MKAVLTTICMLCLGMDGNTQRKGIVPDYVKLQFAGTIGFLAVGAGYENRNQRLQADFYYGYLPESIGGDEIHSVTGKLTWIAIVSGMAEYRLQLLSTGLLVNYAFGKQFFVSSAPGYSFRYYGFPTALDIGIFVGGGVEKGRWGLYYEAITTGKKLASFIPNRESLKLGDILNLGFGMRYRL